jgi:predicted nuclease with TOPRIM domain
VSFKGSKIMIDNKLINELLEKSKKIEQQIEEDKKKSQELNNKLIELNTKKQQVLDELKNLGVTEETLDSTIENLCKEVQDGIAKFEELNK